jgi:hypothetical protein
MTVAAFDLERHRAALNELEAHATNERGIGGDATGLPIEAWEG